MALSLAAFSLFAVSCGDIPGDSQTETPSPTPPAIAGPSTTHSPATPPSVEGGNEGLPDSPAPSMISIETLVDAFPNVVVGVVQDGSELRYKETYPGSACADPYTVFSIKVESVVYSVAPVSPDIPLAIYGGPEQENCVSTEPVDAPKLEAGSRLLLFLLDQREFGTPGYLSIHFEIKDGLIVPTGDEATFPAMAEVSGIRADEALLANSSADPKAALEALAHVTVEDATARVLAAIAEVEPTGPPSEGAEATAAP